MLDDLKSVSDLVNMSILRSEYLILQISETDPKLKILSLCLYLSQTLVHSGA